MATEHQSAVIEIWSFRTDVPQGGADLTGFEVEARDGRIGKIDEVTAETASSYVVVDTGPWIFGKKVMLPAGVIRGVDRDSQVVYVDRTKDEIKNAPELGQGSGYDDYRQRLGEYYAGFEAPGERPGVGIDRTLKQG
jgi:hypothetical protein